VELAHVRVPHGRGDAAVGHDAGKIEMLDAAFPQHPFEARSVERRIGDLLHVDVGGCERADELLAPASRREVALLQKGPKLLEMRRYDRSPPASRHECEQRRNRQDAPLARKPGERREARRQGGDVGGALPSLP
jgi:hypothetical protein